MAGRGAQQGVHGNIRGPGVSLLLPYRVEGVCRFLEARVHTLARQTAYVPGIAPSERVLREGSETPGAYQRIVIIVTQARQEHISQGIMVRGVITLRSVGPAVPVAPVSVVEAVHIVVQEGGHPAPAGIAQGRFRDDGVTLHPHLASVGRAGRSVEHLPEEPAQGSEGAGQAGLHLGHVPLLVNGEIGLPGHRNGVGRVRSGVEFHSAWRPHHGAVRDCVFIVQQHWHFPLSLELAWLVSGALAHGRPPALKLRTVHPGERIPSTGIDDAVMLRVHASPPQGSAVGTAQVELCAESCRTQEGQAEQQYVNPSLFHNRMKAKVSIFVPY